MITLHWDKLFFLWHQMPDDWAGLATFMGEMVGAVLIIVWIERKAPWWAIIPCVILFVPLYWILWDLACLTVKLDMGLVKG